MERANGNKILEDRFLRRNLLPDACLSIQLRREEKKEREREEGERPSKRERRKDFEGLRGRRGIELAGGEREEQASERACR